MAKYTVLLREQINRFGEVLVEADSVSKAYAIVNGNIDGGTLDMGVFDPDTDESVKVDIRDIEEE